MTTKYQDPEATLDYVFDWSSWLASGETITAFTVTVPTGLTLGTDTKAPSQLAGKVTFWVSGGSAGVAYTVECKITTSVGRIDERSFILQVEER